VEVGAESAHSKEGTADTDSGTAELGLGRLNDTAQRGGALVLTHFPPVIFPHLI
jgi:hypothetical protein